MRKIYIHYILKKRNTINHIIFFDLIYINYNSININKYPHDFHFILLSGIRKIINNTCSKFYLILNNRRI